MTHQFTKLGILGLFLIVLTSWGVKKLFFDVSISNPSLTGLCVGGGYQTLGDIVITEGFDTDFTATTSGNFLRLQITGNFQFEPDVGTVSVASGGGEDLSNASIVVSANQVIVFYDADATPDHSDVMTISGLRVRAITAAGSGNLRMTGGAAITGITPTTDFATFTSVAAPNVTLTDSDADNIICSGQSVTFTATGASNYQFFVNGVLVETNFTGSFSTSTLTDGAVVSVTGTNAGCSTTVVGAPFTVNPSPFAFLTSNDADNIICVGQSITFTASASGTNYRFLRGGTQVQNGASNTFTIANPSVGNAGAYTVEVTLGSCTTTSNTINLVVNALPDVGYNTSGMTLSYSSNDNTGRPLRGATFGGTLNGVLQASGVGSYSGVGVVGEQFFPNAAGEGDHTITYTYTDPVTGCSASASIVIQVFAAVDAINGLETVYCDGSGIQPIAPGNLTPNFTTVFQNSVVLTRFIPIFGTLVPVTATFTRNSPILYSISGAGILGAPGSYRINTNALVLDTDYDISASVEYTCSGGNCAAFGTTPGGNYTYTRTKRTRRKSNPNVDFTGFVTGANFCSDATGIQLSATNTLPSSAIVSIPNIQGEYLISRNPTTGFNVAPNTVVNATTKIFNPSAIPGTTISGIAVPNPITSSQVFYLKYRFTDSDGCVDESPVKMFRLNPIPIPTFSGVLPNYCSDAATLTPTPSFNITDEPFNTNNGYFYVKDNTNTTVRIFGFGATTLNLNLPSPLPVADGYTLHYVYFTNKGCSAESVPFTFNIKPNPTVDFTGLNAEYCRNAPNASLTAIVNGSPNPGGTFRIRRVSPAPTAFELLYADRTFRPTQPLPSETGAVPGFYEIEYSFSQSFPGISCPNTVIKTVTLHDLPNLNFDFPVINQTGVVTGAICRDQNSITLIPAVNGNTPPMPTNGRFRITRTAPTAQPSFNLADGLNTIDFGAAQFAIPTNTTDEYIYNIEYVYRDGNNCENTSVVKTLTVNPSPTLQTSDIQITNRCLGDVTQFIVNAPPSVVGFQWSSPSGDFAPTAQTSNNTFSFQYTSTGTKNVTLTVSNTQNCVQVIPLTFEIKPKPTPNFNFLGQCLGSPTQFTDQTTIAPGGDPISSYAWDFGDGNTSTLQNPTHTYTAPGVYNVTLTVQTNANPDLSCPMSISKSVIIFSQYNPITTNPYLETFNANNGGWITGQTGATPSSWQWGNLVSSYNKITPIDGAFWRTFTNATDDFQYRANEQSYIESPCFDISNLDRPALNFDYWVNTRQGQDGVAVLYTVNDGVSWQILGNVGQGVDWYNTVGVTSLPGSNTPGLPTGSVNGWSGDTQTEWRTARFVLDNVKNQAGIGGRVRFRIVFGSLILSTGQYDGFAIDNVRIGSRNRRILLEHFTNAGAPEVASEDSFLNNIADTREESIDIRYHTGFPNPQDPFHDDNTADPSARALFYGISQVPRTTRDGEVFANKYSVIDPTLIEYQKRSLKPSPFEINITFGNNPAELLNVGAVIRAVENFNRPVIVRIAVVEKAVNGNSVGLPGNNFRSIVKRLLPDAAGTRISTNWIKDVTQTTVNQSYNPVGFYDPNQMAVVVFIQDEVTKEIHQTAYAEPTTIPSGVLAIGDELSNQIRLYPNPTKDKAFIQTNGLGTLTYEVFDGVGKMVAQGEFSESTHELDTQKYASGLYMIRLRNTQGQMGYKKLVISR